MKIKKGRKERLHIETKCKHWISQKVPLVFFFLLLFVFLVVVIIFLCFLSKNKRHIFHFQQELHWTRYSPICSTTICHFSGNFIIPSSQNFLSFWAKDYSRCCLQSSRELKIFPLRKCCKDWNKWKSEGARSAEYNEWIRTSQSSCNTFAWASKITWSCIIVMEDYAFSVN